MVIDTSAQTLRRHYTGIYIDYSECVTFHCLVRVTLNNDVYYAEYKDGV